MLKSTVAQSSELSGGQLERQAGARAGNCVIDGPPDDRPIGHHLQRDVGEGHAALSLPGNRRSWETFRGD